MRGRTLFFAALIIFAIFTLGKMFRTDSSNPESVLKGYLNNWRSENGRSMYPLLSQRAKGEFSRLGIQNAIDYLAYVAENRDNLIDWSLRSRSLGSTACRFSVTLKSRDLFGKESTREVIFNLVLERDGWRIDNYKQGTVYALP